VVVTAFGAATSATGEIVAALAEELLLLSDDPSAVVVCDCESSSQQFPDDWHVAA
jgi:hypothetical protein